jgi:general secretion pathway protein D
MKNIPANNIQRITLIIAMLLGLNLTTTTVFAQDANASEKIQLMSEALLARDAGELLLAKEKVEMLIALAPNDTNVQNLLLSINQSIEDEGLIVPNASEADSKVEANAKEAQDSSTSSFFSAFSPMSQSKLLPVEEVSPVFAEQSSEVENLLLIARSQIAAGDLASATSTIEEIEARDSNSKEAKQLAIKLSQALQDVQGLNLYETRTNMLNAVENSWEQPKVFELENTSTAADVVVPTLLRKLENIILPKVNFTGMALTRVVETLSELSVQYDPEGQGVNMVALFDSSEFNPKVNITLRNLSLDKILQFVTQQVNFTYDVGEDAVTVQASDSIGGSSSTLTEFFPITRATASRLTGLRDASRAPSDNPFEDESAASGPSQDQETQALQKFFQNAGVNFDGVIGTSLAFDGEQLIVTQTPRNLERLRTILVNYNEFKQVEIEAKFLEVAQNDLDELGFHWGFSSNGKSGEDWNIATNLRTLSDLNSVSNASGTASISGIADPVISAPQISGSLGFGTSAGFFVDKNTVGEDANGSPIDLTQGFVLDDLKVDLQIQALARKTGSDLMSAPKVTVLSGKEANIVVAQELRYPTSYGDIESTVSSGGGGGETGGSAAVSITAGTPQDFTTRNVGVEMSVTPNVESDDTISLILKPRVTEFEGFVEYGGPSIALSGSTTAVVPAGFYQPIFSTREITTEVTIYDGATVVMGGLTRDEVRSVNDKVPFLGDIPGLGRLFRSEGETRQKRNLLIFVTANLVTPGGSLSNQSYDNIKANTIYQSPSVATPAGSKFRNVTIAD